MNNEFILTGYHIFRLYIVSKALKMKIKEILQIFKHFFKYRKKNEIESLFFYQKIIKNVNRFIRQNLHNLSIICNF